MRIVSDALFVNLPEPAASYALPESLRKWGLRRYGGDGSFHAWMLRQVRDLRRGRVISIHLNDAPNLAAFKAGKAVETSLGFTWAEGLPSAVSCGDLDPSIPLLLAEQGLDPREIEQLLGAQSGWKALLGREAALPDLLNPASPGARLAYEILLHGLEKGIGQMLAALAGADAILFGSQYLPEGLDLISELCEGLDFIGVRRRAGWLQESKTVWRLTEESSPVAVLAFWRLEH